MKQLTQQLKSGKMEILEVPFPMLGDKQILVRNHFSLISAGTEGKTVTDARKGYIAKAKSRQKELKQVIEMIKSNGLKSTYDFVMNKLDAPSPLGYSCAGEVIAIGKQVTGFKVGDFVACGGNSAAHADVVAIPINLAVKISKSVSMQEAAFTTLGAIAIQGIRQAELKLGETCLIIGMGLIGQLTAKILQASGVKTIAVDIYEKIVQSSINAEIPNVYLRNHKGIDEIIKEFSNGYGVDGTIITAATNSLDPIEFAGSSTRKKGKVVIVGAVPTGFDRANFYKKELELKMSMSYGPGRSDLSYEDQGIDYPYPYVRWTENRNMQAFVDLLASKSISVSSLISHVYDLEEAEKAYELILNKEENYNAILIKYDEDLPKQIVNYKTSNEEKSSLSIGLIGAGNFAQGILLPKMKGLFDFEGIATSKGNIATYVAKKYGFAFATNNIHELLENDKISTVFITTRHDSHAKLILEALKKDKNIFVEKPLALNESELEEIKETFSNSKSKHLLIGFNRRFSPAILELKKHIANELPKSIQIRVNAGELPLEHWVNHPAIGGGRIIGEACHFVDLAMYIADSKIKTVSADALEKANGLISSVVINLAFENGSIATISYFSNGSKSLNKEFIEVFCGGTAVQIDDFKSISIFTTKEKKIKFKSQDKGHANELKYFHQALKDNLAPIIPFEEAYLSTLATFKVMQSINEARKITI